MPRVGYLFSLGLKLLAGFFIYNFFIILAAFLGFLSPESNLINSYILRLIHLNFQIIITPPAHLSYTNRHRLFGQPFWVLEVLLFGDVVN